jgi:hypothetical protein
MESVFDFFLHESYILSVSLDYCNDWAVKWMKDAVAWSNVCAREKKLWSYISGAEELLDLSILQEKYETMSVP